MGERVLSVEGSPLGKGGCVAATLMQAQPAAAWLARQRHMHDCLRQGTLQGSLIGRLATPP
jgi:hypothetical protein